MAAVHQAMRQPSAHVGDGPLCDLQEEAASDTAAELAELRRQVAKLDQAVRARDDFIAIAAHECALLSHRSLQLRSSR